MMRKFLTRAGRVAAALTITVGLVLVGGQSAALAAPTIAAEVAQGGFTFTVPALADAVQILVTVLLPLFVGFITRREFQHKALVLLGLAAVTGLGTEALATLQAGGVFDLTDGLFRAVLSFGGAVLLHFGIYKSEGTTSAVQKLGPQ